MEYHRLQARVSQPLVSLAVLLLLVLVVPVSEAERALRVVDATGKLVGLYKGSYALLIGVSDYTNGWPDLPGVRGDLVEVNQLLKEHGFEVTVVQDPTARSLRDAFDDFINRYGLHPEYRLLVYYAGHGHTIKQSYGDDMGYLVPADAPNPHQDKNGFLATAMDMQQIEVYAKRMQAKHVLFLFDSCFSGGIFSLGRAVPEHINYKTSQPVRQFITAGGANEKVPDESVFRRQFQAALRGEADTDADGYVTGTELGEFLTNKVINYSKNSQHPQYGKIRNPHLDKGDYVFQITITISSIPGQEPQVEVSPAPTERDISNLEQRLMDKLEQLRQQGKAAEPEAEMWYMVKDSPHQEDISAFLEAYPKGRFAPAARLRLQQLQRLAALPPSSATPPAERPRPAAPRYDSAGKDPTEPAAGITAAAPTAPQYPRSQVQRVQRLLKQAGLDPGPADGMFGARTDDALRRYQGSQDLPVSGVPDEATEKALQADAIRRLQDQRQREAEQRQQARAREQRPAAVPEAEASPPARTTAPRQPAEVQVAVGVYPPQPKASEAFAKTLRNSIGMEFVLIPAGEFLMGAYDGLPYEQPVHRVHISRPFYLGKYEVTQAQWVEVMGSNPSYFVGFQADLQRPVERVSWQQAQEFIRRLNAKEGHDKYRLPTESEWEYAARAGTVTHFNFGDNDTQLTQHDWFLQNAGSRTQPVGLLKPNAWGLYDMQGNVQEWVLDWWGPKYPSGPVTDPEGPPNGTLKVLRGGSWAHVPRQCWVSGRLYNAPSVPHTTYGFRLLRAAP